jgi:hypothetical protein
MPKKKPSAPKPKSIPSSKPTSSPKKKPSKTIPKKTTRKVNKDINIQNNKNIGIKEDKNSTAQGRQTYLFSTKETDLGEFQLDSLAQKKSKDAKDIDLKEAWYCPSKELHDAFRFYQFQNNMKKSNIITKAIVEMLEREGFLKKS